MRSRISGLAGLAGSAMVVATIALAPPLHAAGRLLVGVDRDDDDRSGVADRDEMRPPVGPGVVTLARLATGAPVSLRGPVRIVLDGRVAAPPTRALPGATLAVQGLAPGRADVDAGAKSFAVSVIEVRAFDGAGDEIDPVRSATSIERRPPEPAPSDVTSASDDLDAVRFVLIGVGDDLPAAVTIVSRAPSGAAVDALTEVGLISARCPAGVAAELSCGTTPPLRAVADDVDKNHPLVRDRSVKAELGGALVVVAEGSELTGLRVAGPRKTPIGPVERFRARVRMTLIRTRRDGPPPLGTDVASATAAGRAELKRANALWGACGIGFGPPAELDVRVVDPPPPHLLALGCDLGLPASGGSIRLRVLGRDVAVPIPAGARPARAARLVAEAIARAVPGVEPKVSDNSAIGDGAGATADVSVRRSDGELVALAPPAAGPVSTDRTLTACIGEVHLEDGLSHFGDVDAVAGTVEERTLLKAIDDGDPTTIEVVVLPAFAGGGRIGESFIFGDGGAIRNVVIEDRASVRADRASFGLAHELGHVLLDEPGHPDDYGVDTPTRLMDADSANATAFGPRRLLTSECARAVRQSGPGAPAPLLVPWPLMALGKER